MFQKRDFIELICERSIISRPYAKNRTRLRKAMRIPYLNSSAILLILFLTSLAT